MSTPVLMPQMGESIAEGTVVRWIKKVGDHVDRDEPLFEISTDKVDAEIPSPAAGVLSEIRVHEGETVAVNSVVATIGDGVIAVGDNLTQPDRQPDRHPTQPGPTRPTRPNPTQPDPTRPNPAQPVEDVRRARSSPLVRRIAKEHQIDIGTIAGSGVGGRVTKQDILGFLEHRPAEHPRVRRSTSRRSARASRSRSSRWA